MGVGVFTADNSVTSPGFHLSREQKRRISARFRVAFCNLRFMASCLHVPQILPQRLASPNWSSRHVALGLERSSQAALSMAVFKIVRLVGRNKIFLFE